MPPSSGGTKGLFIPGDAGSAGSGSASGRARVAAASSTSSSLAARPNTAVRGGSGRNAGRASGSTAAIATDQDTWQVWWSRNRHTYLGRAIGSPTRAPVTAAGSGRPLGSRVNAEHTPSGTPSRADIYTHVVPGLLSVLQSDSDPEVLAAAALALGRAVSQPLEGPVTEALLPLLAHQDSRVQHAAALGLGLAGGEDGLLPLMDLATCSQAGHQLVGASMVSDRLRTTAALAVGLLDHPDAVVLLMQAVDTLPHSDDAVRAGAVLALGAMQHPAAQAAGPWLAQASADRRLPHQLQTSLPTALGRLALGGGDQALVALLGARDLDRAAEQAALAALGASVALTDGEALSALIHAAFEHKDAQSRHMALLALARASARSQSASVGAAQAQADIARLLDQQLQRPSHGADRDWVALAAGIVCNAGPLSRARLAPVLSAAYRDASSPEQRSALALALGLGGVSSEGERLLADFLDAKDPDLQSNLALALGLMGHAQAAPALRDALLADAQPAELRVELATALRLLGDETTPALLASAYPEAQTTAARDGLASALGELRHRNGLPALLQVAADADRPARDRAAACAAIGRLAEKTTTPFTARFTRDDVPGQGHPAVDELLLPR